MLKTILAIIGLIILMAMGAIIPYIIYIVKFCDSVCKGDM